MRRVGIVLLMVAVAAIGWLLAPQRWATGDGRLEIRTPGASVTVPVDIGSREPQSITVDDLTVDLPGGVPVDERVEVVAIGAGLGDRQPEVVLVLPDGSEELLPVLERDGDRIEAGRRPPRDARPAVALLAAVVVAWVSEIVPLHVTALAIPVALTMGDVEAADAALAPFFDPIIVLFLAGFLMARALQRSGLDRLAAATIVHRTGTDPLRLFIALVVTSAIASMWMSNTAAATVLLPIAIAVTAPLGAPGYQRTVVLGIAYAATIGGVGSAIGTPANPLAMDFLDRFADRDVSFVGWFAFGIPMLVLFLPVLIAYLWWRGDTAVEEASFRDAREVAGRERSAAGRLTGHQVEVLVVFAAVMAGWLSQPLHGVNTGIVALAGAVVLMAINRIEPDDLGRISWSTLLTFGGGLTLGTALVTTGTADWVVTRLAGVASWPQPLAVAAVAAVALGVTTVASNTASAATLIPLAIPLAGLIGVDPAQLVVTVAMASSIDFALVIGTPPTMLAYGTGLFRVRDILRIGSVLDVAGLLLLVTAVPAVWNLFGIV